MVIQLARHDAKWLAPAPLWNRERIADLSNRNGSAWRPSILRFDNDLFMDEALATLAYYPDRLPEWIALPETWERPMEPPRTAPKLEATEPVSEQSKKIKRRLAKKEVPAAAVWKKDGAKWSGGIEADETIPFKLYQPAHQRYYLVAASLICQQHGMPDRRVDPGRQESTHFVLRRVSYTYTDKESRKPYDPTDPDWEEYAFVAAPDGGFAWKLILEKRDATQAGEERLPLFSLHYNETEGNRRRVFAGLIPVGKREAYLSAPGNQNKTTGSTEAAAEAPEEGTDPRRLLFEAKVTGPWGALIEQAATIRSSFKNASGISSRLDVDDNPEEQKKIMKTSRDQIQTISWYSLFDFAHFLDQYLNDVWQVVLGNKRQEELTNDYQRELCREMDKIRVNYSLIRPYPDPTIAPPAHYYDDKNPLTKLTDALKAIHGFDRLERTTADYKGERLAPGMEWPPFTFPLTDPGLDDFRNGPLPGITIEESGLNDWEAAIAKLDKLPSLVEKALPPAQAGTLADLRPPQQPLDPGSGWFVIRCVYERPNCSLKTPAVVSEPTEKFQMAPFFDPDAPARAVRISLPADISPAGLRKFKKSATLMMSDMLCGKVGEIRKLTFGDLVLSVLPWPFHKDLPKPDKTGPCKKGHVDAGMYCSLSIPIVTLVALILMIIMVSLFDIFFRWVPYLFTCFPVPGFKGKKA